MAYWPLFFLITAFALAYLRAGLRASSLAVGFAVLFYGLFGDSWLIFVVLAVAGAVLFLPLNLGVLREEWLSRPLFRGYRRVLSRLDERQVSAIAAGSAGWDAQLFDGQPDWNAYAERYVMRLTPDERALVIGPVAEFCGRFARDPGTPNAIARLRAYGLFGVGIDLEHGGKGYSAIAQAAVLGRLAAGAGSRAALAAGDLSRLRWIDLLKRHGEPAQQSLWLPRFALGPIVQADDQRVTADALVVAGQGALELELTLATPLAADTEVLLLRADVRDPGQRLHAGERGGPTLLIIEASAIRSDGGPLRVGLDCVLGGRERLGCAAFDYAESRAVAHAIAPAAIHAGAATAIALAAGSAARLRAPFEPAPAAQALAQEALARLAALAYAAQALAAASARAVDLGEKPVGPAAFARTLSVQQARRCHAAALDLGLERGGLRRLVEDLDAGADDGDEAPLLARPDAYAACVLRSHAAFMAALGAANSASPAEAMKRFDAALWDCVGHLLSSGARALALGLTAGGSLFAVGSLEQRLRRRINRYSAALAFASDVALGLLGRELGSKQPYTALRGLREASRLSLTTWLGDALAQLYRASAALRQYEDGGADPAERAVLELICTEAFAAIEEALDRIARHLWSRPLSLLVRLITRPLGAAALAPNDHVQRQVATQASGDGALRERLALRSGLPADASTWPLLEAALEAQHAAEAAEAKAIAATASAAPRHATTRIALAEQLGAINAGEARVLHDWLAAVARFRAA